LLAALVVNLGLLVGTAQATPLNLVPPGPPDITSSFICVDYDAGSGAFSASGTADALNNEHAIMGTFDISMALNPATGVPSSGTLTITGSIDDLGIPGPTLLTGSIAEFGFAGPLDPLEFVFTATGGALKSDDYYPQKIGVILHDSGFGGTFTQSFSNYWEGTSDAFAISQPIPEPSTWALLLALAGGGSLLFRRRLTCWLAR
jgi:hypothetical protein